MLKTIEFDGLSAMLLGFIDEQDGFLYLRMTGQETAIGAIWSRLSGRKDRGSKWGSPVKIPSYSNYDFSVASYKNVNYRTIRTSLPCGMIDLAMIHPAITIAEDSPASFHLLSHDEGIPAGFFDRLNKCLSIPIKLEWTDWLWEQGKKEQNVPVLSKYSDEIQETPVYPIYELDSQGAVRGYRITTAGNYKAAWLQIIRAQLDTGIRLDKSGNSYRNGKFAIHQSNDEWILLKEGDLVVKANDLKHLLFSSNQAGYPLIIEENNE